MKWKFRNVAMTIWNNKAFTENELSRYAKTALVSLLVIPVIFVTILNIIRGEVHHPYGFIICLVGFALFLISKSSLFSKGKWISFGTKKLTENMGNLYRFGYWLMAVGLFLTFIR
jgi:hypothetical protein